MQDVQVLRQSNDFLNIVLDNITSAVFIVDQDTRIRSVNNSFQTLFNTEEQRVVGSLCGKGIGCIFTENGRIECGTTVECKKCELRCTILDTFLDLVPATRIKVDRRVTIGGLVLQKYFLLTSRLVGWDGETVALLILDDISDQETARLAIEVKNKELQRLNEEKNRFLSIAAHDLRNPIGAVQTFSKYLIDRIETIPAEKLKEYLSVINTASRFSITLLNQLLDIAMIESGRIVLEKERCNIVDTARRVVDINRIFAENKSIQIELTSALEIMETDIDQPKIEQVLHNLISNAVKYSNSDTVIRIKLAYFGGQVLVEVIDEGPGIPPEEQPNLFRGFSKTSNKTTAGEQSTGLGLFISKLIIDAHKGNIGVKSIPNKGSTFFFTLPIA